MTVRVRNWAKFQHFKDRRPPWIKLYRDLLDDINWHRLDAEAAKSLVMMWVIASENEGNLPDVETLAFRLRKSDSEVASIISKLSHWLEHGDITTISERYQDDAPERETETERETEKKPRIRAATPSIEGVSESLLADYLQVRKAKKAGPLTDTAIAGLQREAGKAGLSLSQAVTACVEFGWQGFNAGWYAERTKGKPGQFAADSHDPESRSAIEAEGVEKGIGRWNEMNEQWHIYRARVKGHRSTGFDLNALAAMAAQRQGAH